MMRRGTSTRLQYLGSGILVTICLILLYSHLQEDGFAGSNVAGPPPPPLQPLRPDRLPREDGTVEGKAVIAAPRGQSKRKFSSADLSIPSPYGALDRNSPLIFIGGVPRSGTTLMRAMLDAHPDVRCGEETRVIPRILGLRAQWHRSEKEWNRLQQAGVTDEVLNRAISSFILQVIAGHGEPAPRLCNKDPFTLKSTAFLTELFPNAKFIFMIRDGRATVHSIITRKITITGFDLTDYRQSLEKWNAAISTMDQQCEAVGQKCLRVRYEELVLHPEPQLRRILNFLDLPWNSTVLHHEQHIGKDIKLSNVERSSDQVVKPVNVDALTKWVGVLPKDVIDNMAEIAPMLEALGYDPRANPPNYGTPDAIVAKKTEDVHKNADKWFQKAAQVVDDPARIVDRPDSFAQAANADAPAYGKP